MMLRFLRRSLILTHRYLGLALGLMVLVWFASGIVMMYAGGMPRISPSQRLERLDALDLSQVRLTPSQAETHAARGAGGRGGAARMLTVMGRPAYRIGSGTVFADTGETMAPLTLGETRRIAAHFVNAPESDVDHVRTLTRVDQWTLQSPMPLHKFRVDDPDLTEVYVDPATGEVSMLTTGRSRILSWMGTIPHWLYFGALRANQPLWYRVVVWTSGAACVLSLLGLVLGFTQFRKTRPFRLSAAIPYSGWMRWHYVTGAVFGVFTLTWAFSGLLSMEPFQWTNAEGLPVRGDVFTGGRVDLDAYPAMEPALWKDLTGGRAIKEVEFARMQGEHYYVVRLEPEPMDPRKRERLHQPYYITGQVNPDRLLVRADTLEARTGPFSSESLLVRLVSAAPAAAVVDSELLTAYDSYYYSRTGQLPLPVFRVKFDDPAETWIYADPEMNQLILTLPRLARLERWLYNGLHSLDFAFWYTTPFWDAGMIVLLLGGMATTSLGLWVGIRRLVRQTIRAARG